MANPHNLIPELRAFIGTSPRFKDLANSSIPELNKKPLEIGDFIYQTFDSEAYSENSKKILHYHHYDTPVLNIHTPELVFMMAIEESRTICNYSHIMTIAERQLNIDNIPALKQLSSNNGIVSIFDTFMFEPLLNAPTITWDKKKNYRDNDNRIYYMKPRVIRNGKTQQLGRYVMEQLLNRYLIEKDFKLKATDVVHHKKHRRICLWFYLEIIDSLEHTKRHGSEKRQGKKLDRKSNTAFFNFLKWYLNCDEMDTLVNNLNFLTSIFSYFKGLKVSKSLDLARTDITHMSLNEILNSIEELY